VKKEIRKNFRGAGRVAFLARKDSIQKMMREGYPALVIHEKYKDELGISYSQFLRYVKTYFVSGKDEERKAIPAQDEKEPVSVPGIKTPPSPTPQEPDKNELEDRANESDFF